MAVGVQSAPILVAPADEATEVEPEEETFLWNTVENAESYELSIATNSSFDSNSIVFTQTDISENNIDIPTAYILKGATYYWKVRAKNAIGISDWSVVWKFTTIEQINAPILISPENEATAQEPDLTLDWSAVTGAISYNVQVSINPDMSAPILDENLTETVVIFDKSQSMHTIKEEAQDDCYGNEEVIQFSTNNFGTVPRLKYY